MKKTMRFLSMAALALVGAVMTGCSSDDNSISEPQQPETKSNVVTLTTTVSLDGGAATTRSLTSGGVKTFATGETMALVYKNTNNETVRAVSAALTQSNIANDSQSATFTFELTDPNKSQDVTYIYPAAMANTDGTVNYDALYNNQDGTLATLASNFDFCTNSGAWAGDNLPSLTLENQLAILALTLKDADGTNDITSTITGMTLSDGTYSYAVTRSAAAGPIYVAIRPTSSATITVTATDGSKNYTKSLTGKTYAAGNGYPLSWMMTEAVPEGVINGNFTINAGGTQVYFSKGNLRYASGTWSFFDNQYDYYTSYSADAWDKFGWSTSATTYGMKTSESSNDTYSGDFVDWGATMGTGWFTLSSAEWTYVFNTRTTGGTVFDTEKARYAHATINTDGTSVNGMILFPDGVDIASSEVTTAGTVNNASAWGTKCTSAQWSALAAKGCVFLPAAGYRWPHLTGDFSDTGSIGDYWSSSPNGASNAYGMQFYSGILNPTINFDRYLGFSVRLVRQVE